MLLTLDLILELHVQKVAVTHNLDYQFFEEGWRIDQKLDVFQNIVLSSNYIMFTNTDQLLF